MSYSSGDPTAPWSAMTRGSENFPSPFFDMASMAMPDTNKSALQWCEHLFMSNETLRMAIERIIAYFLTDIEIGAASSLKPLGEDEKDKWEAFLNDQLKIVPHIQALNRDTMCYGNGFCSLIVPFKRMLICKRCRQMNVVLKEFYENPAYQFRFSQCEFHGKCPKCSYSGEWIVNDLPDNAPGKITLKRWSPHELSVLHSPITDECHYYWQIPDDFKMELKNGRPSLFHLERTSMEMLKAIRLNQLYKFTPGSVYHMKEHTLAGLKNRGWGISRLITTFRQAWYVQVLRRYNEAIALDYVIPFRLITPGTRGGGSAEAMDPLLSIDTGDFMSQVRSLLRRRRRNPSEWHTLGYPVEYQMLGGEAQQLAPKDLLDQGLETLLNGIGTPVELYKGTLQLQTAPVSMRLFEATWYHLVYGNNDFLRWLTERVSRVLSWETVDARHRRVQHADDMQRHMALLQLMMGGSISQTTGLRALGLDFLDETRQLAEEARAQQRQQEEMQEEMETQSFGKQVSQTGSPMGGGAPPGGAPPGGGAPPPGGVDPTTGQPAPAGPVTSMVQNNYMPQTPDDMLSQAQSIANQLLGLPESQKDSELRMLKQKNEVLHSLVKAQLDKIRGQARSQGGAQLMQQQFGGGGGAPPQ